MKTTLRWIFEKEVKQQVSIHYRKRLLACQVLLLR